MCALLISSRDLTSYFPSLCLLSRLGAHLLSHSSQRYVNSDMFLPSQAIFSTPGLNISLVTQWAHQTSTFRIPNLFVAPVSGSYNLSHLNFTVTEFEILEVFPGLVETTCRQMMTDQLSNAGILSHLHGHYVVCLRSAFFVFRLCPYCFGHFLGFCLSFSGSCSAVWSVVLSPTDHISLPTSSMISPTLGSVLVRHSTKTMNLYLKRNY